MDHPTLRGDRVVLRPLTAADRPRLREIRAEPEVARWWALGGTVEAAGEPDDDADVELAVELDGQLVGQVQYGEEAEPDYRHASIDIFLATAVHGQGVGSDAVRTLARYLFDERGHHRLTIDPAASNGRAIAAYARVGFKSVGVMRQYERGPDGTWHDGLLMDLLRDELRESNAGQPRSKRG
jgi:aminoglycoside 6'-N-acetyltransferase